ncbi:MAG TPA: isocitrate/isopropylmalate dehydrogenase family protein [Candidatus Acidoferrales bacterium]|nr:isocitrate/isopropylmalate dehydrogenase family protein [Candidatus Acidoferrales bacterium]
MSRSHTIAVISGDGIGPEVTTAALRVLDAAERRFNFSTSREEYAWSSARYVEFGERIGSKEIDGLRRFDAILFGAIGDPRAPRGVVERAVILGMRRQLDLFVNLRPIVAYDDRLVPLKNKPASSVDMIVVRENTEDVYTQTGAITGTGKDQVAEVPMRFTRPGIERVVRYAFDLARSRKRKRLTLVDKSNAIQVQQLWRDIFDEIGRDYADVEKDAMYVDAACMWMLQKPEQFDTIVTTNLFGDIITDLGAALCGGLGVAASGNIHPGKTSMFEPIHGSAPKYTGQNVASPIGAIGALAMLLRHVGEREAGDAIERAVASGLRSGRVKGVEAGMQKTDEVARIISEAVAAA